MAPSLLDFEADTQTFNSKNTVNPLISPWGLVCKNGFLVGVFFKGGGLISKFSIFLKGQHINDMIFLTTNIIIFYHHKSHFFAFWSPVKGSNTV